jgi:hypothetical protein
MRRGNHLGPKTASAQAPEQQSIDPPGSYGRANKRHPHPPVLDADWVPQYVMETLIYHEMLHWLFRPRLAGDRRVLHSEPSGRPSRRTFAMSAPTSGIQKNLDRLLRR